METSPSRARRWIIRLSIAGAIVVTVALLVTTGVIDRISSEEELRRTVDRAGAFGPLVFLALMIGLVPLNVPGLLFVIPSTTLFGTVPGVLLSLTGGFIASTIGIVLARRLGRAALVDRIPDRLSRLEVRISRQGFWAVVVLRVFTFLTQPVDWLIGLSSIPMRTVLVGTFVGLIPPTLVIALSGGSILDLIF